MTDIVERLRDWQQWGPYTDPYTVKLIDAAFREAAAEIERLRGEKAKLVDEIVHGSVELTQLRAKLAEYENVPVRLRHIMKTGKLPPND